VAPWMRWWSRGRRYGLDRPRPYVDTVPHTTSRAVHEHPVTSPIIMGPTHFRASTGSGAVRAPRDAAGYVNLRARLMGGLGLADRG